MGGDMEKSFPMAMACPIRLVSISDGSSRVQRGLGGWQNLAEAATERKKRMERAAAALKRRYLSCRIYFIYLIYVISTSQGRLKGGYNMSRGLHESGCLAS
jgi:hypothetical protein